MQRITETVANAGSYAVSKLPDCGIMAKVTAVWNRFLSSYVGTLCCAHPYIATGVVGVTALAIAAFAVKKLWFS